MFAGERSRVEREWLELRDGTTEESRARQQFHELTQHMSAQEAQEFKTLWFPELCPQEQESQKKKRKNKRKNKKDKKTKKRQEEAGGTQKKQKNNRPPPWLPGPEGAHLSRGPAVNSSETPDKK